MASSTEDKVRLDKWLWAARFFKTRSLATDAVNGGKVHVNEQRAKPARSVLPGDRLQIRRGYSEQTVVVLALSGRRGPASDAAELYRETEASIASREAQAEQRRLINLSAPKLPARRPNKKDRRHIIRFTQQSTESD